MKLIILFDTDADIIEVPYKIKDSLIVYQKLFLKWLYDKSSNHKYWLYQSDKQYGVSYRSEASVHWLNAFILDNNEAKIIKQGIKEWDCNLTYIHF